MHENKHAFMKKNVDHNKDLCCLVISDDGDDLSHYVLFLLCPL